MPSGRDMSSFYARHNERAAHHVARDTDFVTASYERYLHSAPTSSYGGETVSSSGGLDGLHEINDLRVLSCWGSEPALAAQSRFMGVTEALGGSNPALAAQSQFMGVEGRPEIPLPSNASSTLFVEGLPTNCTRREGSKAGKQGVKTCKIFCGYIFDENNYDSSHLRLQFARSPGARSGGGHRHGKH